MPPNVIELIRFTDGTNGSIEDVNEKVLEGQPINSSQDVGEDVGTLGGNDPSALELA